MDGGTFFNLTFSNLSSTSNVNLNSSFWVYPCYLIGDICNISLSSCQLKIKIPLPQSFFALV